MSKKKNEFKSCSLQFHFVFLLGVILELGLKTIVCKLGQVCSQAVLTWEGKIQKEF